MNNPRIYLAIATFCTMFGGGLTLLDVAIFGDAAKVFVGFLSIMFGAAGGAFNVMGGGRTAPIEYDGQVLNPDVDGGGQ